MIIEETDYLMHYGILRKSGRYPWGSGDDVTQRSKSMLDHVEKLQAQGVPEKTIAEGFGMTTTQLREAKTISKNALKQADIAMAVRLKEKGLSNVAVGERMGINESSVRALLKDNDAHKTKVLDSTTSMLKAQVAEKEFIQIGSGVEAHLGISQQKLRTAVGALKEEGYKVVYPKVQQVTTGKYTTVKVLAGPDADIPALYRDPSKIKMITEFSQDGGLSYNRLKPPMSFDSKRLAVRYNEEGGGKTDGVIYIRPGIKDTSLGHSNYAQVRIAVDGTHFIKGMAMYKDDLPPGVDLMFNTNKSDTGNKLDALKPMKDDPDNPFGSSINRQLIEVDAHGKEHVTSVMNIVAEEGKWDTWSRSLSSQIVSKQNPVLAKTQLDMAYENRKAELDGIMALTNPEVKRKLLQSFADGTDVAAVDLKAAALPRQSSHVILPIESMKSTEVYAPNFNHGERVVLIRHPHGGTFEIPELIVNNRQREAKKLLGQAPDAIGINSKVAEKLSGADFDGDTVIVIPNERGHIKTAPTLEGLKNFDPKAAYPAYDGMPKMTPTAKQHQMGLVSNLITDMTIKGAQPDEIARAVRHSMVVIDAEKHNLNYRESARANGISELKEKYQTSKQGGASTLISRAGSEKRVGERNLRRASKGGPIDPTTGEKVWEYTGETYVSKKTGKLVPKTIKSTKLYETSDAFTLSSGTPIEKIYATHSNQLKALANQARKEILVTKSLPVSNSAKKAYTNEVTTLDAKLNVARQRRPLERQAQLIANTTVSAKKKANPDMTNEELKKVKTQSLNEARNRVGLKQYEIDITPKEWDAIQAGAIAPSKLNEILNKANEAQVKKYATPKEVLMMNPSKTKRAKQMYATGYTQAEIAAALGVSLTTLKTTISEG